MVVVFSLGQDVVLSVPENPRLHMAPARIVELTDWGAHVVCRAAATGRFRAGYSEMVPAHQASDGLADDTAERTTAAIESGYSGDVCDSCGSLQMRRSGACLTCDSCGANSGCG